MPEVVLTVAGDRASMEVEVDPLSALGPRLAEWAAACSSRPPEELVMVSGNARQVFDPSGTPASLGLDYGTVVRLMTGPEAAQLRNASAAPAFETPPQAPEPRWSEHIAAAQPSRPSSGIADRRQPGRVTSGESPSTPYADEPFPQPHRPPSVPPSNPWHASSGFVANSAPLDWAEPDEPLPERVSSGRRFARGLKAVLGRRATSVPQTGQFAKPSVPKAGERYRHAIQANNRSYNLERMIREAPLRRCMVIAVVSPKGGAGKTTVTALLGMLFAELRRDPVLALDANPDFGNLKDKLGRTGELLTATDELAAWLDDEPAATPAELSGRLGTGPHGVRFLPSPAGDLDRMVRAADVDLYRRLLARLRDYEGIIVVDCGTGLLDPPVRAALETADQIVLVTDSSADTAGLVATAANHLPPTPTWLVGNKMPVRGTTVDIGRVRAAIPRLKGVTIIPEQRLTENIVTPQFDWADAPDQWQEPVREIAARLANNWRMIH